MVEKRLADNSGDAKRQAGGGSAQEEGAVGGWLIVRLVGTWLAIVVVMVVGSVLVVNLFGSVAREPERSIDGLLSVLESGDVDGEEAMGVREQELWRAAGELANRLAKEAGELQPWEMEPIVSRLSGLVDREVKESGELSALGRQRVEFLLRGLGHTKRAEAAGALLRCLEHPSEAMRREALMSLAQLGKLPAVRAGLGRMCAAIDDEEPVVQTVACWVMSHVAEPTDGEVLAGLARACGSSDREVRWNAALSLARLGSDQGKGILLKLLDRDYWEGKVKVRLESGEGGVVEEAMPAGAVDAYLAAAIEAAGNLEDAALMKAIEKLQRDGSAMVAGRARAVVEKKRTGAAVGEEAAGKTGEVL